jgi:8-oxo-dGTP pyrophosphatase MutT (NUDIX family)
MTIAPSARRYQDLLSFFDCDHGKRLDPIRHPDRMVNTIAESELSRFRSAAVLIAVTRPDANAESQVVLTVRSANLKSHASQISFPGGTTEKQDRDSVATALRETHEEIGLHPSNVEVIGCIGDIALPSGYRVTPVVGIIDNNLDYLANPAEVEAIFHAPLSLALDPEAYTHSAVTYRDVERTVLELHYEEHRIWGATAAILYHLASLI